MCGLWGAFAPNALDGQEREFVKHLATLSTFRGLDGSGCLIASARKRKYYIYAEMVTPSELVYGTMDGITEVGKKMPINLMMGHNRQATMGAVNRENLHPYDFDTLVGAHNGTIPKFNETQHHRNPNKLSDSYFLLQAIDKDGLEEVLKTVHFGAYALTIYDKKKNHLVFTRNKERELYFAYSKSGAVHWASERMFLSFAGWRGKHDQWLKSTPEGTDRYEELPPHVVRTWDFNTAKWLDEYELKPEPVRSYHYTEPAKNTWLGRGREHLQQKRDAMVEEVKEEVIPLLPKPSVPTVPSVEKPVSDKLVAIGSKPGSSLHEYVKFQRYRGYKGLYYPIATIMEHLKQGDALYGKQGDISDEILWFGPSDWIFKEDKNHSLIRDCYAPDDDMFYEGRVVVRASQPKEVAVG